MERSECEACTIPSSEGEAIAIIEPAAQQSAPWRQRELSYGTKLVVSLGGGLLLIASLVLGIVWLVLIPSMVVNGPGPRDTLASMLALGVFLTLALATCLVALWMLWPLLRARMRFAPSYGVIPATTMAHPFEVRFERVGLGRTLEGKGTMCFKPHAVYLSGTLTPSPITQLAFGVLIARLIGRKRIEMLLLYHQLSSLRVEGCRVTIDGPGRPQRVAVAVAACDGERLYRELLPRFPSALNGWQGLAPKRGCRNAGRLRRCHKCRHSGTGTAPCPRRGLASYVWCAGNERFTVEPGECAGAGGRDRRGGGAAADA